MGEGVLLGGVEEGVVGCWQVLCGGVLWGAGAAAEISKTGTSLQQQQQRSGSGVPWTHGSVLRSQQAGLMSRTARHTRRSPSSEGKDCANAAGAAACLLTLLVPLLLLLLQRSSAMPC